MRSNVFSFVLVLAFIVQPVAAASMGVSPARITKDNLLPGSSLEEVIIVSKDDEQSTLIRTHLQGDAQDWITHPPEIVFPANTKSLRIPFNITIPQNIKLGNYSATIQYFVASDSDLQMAFSMPIHLDVVNTEDTSYHIKHVRAYQEDEETRIVFEVHNKGNVLSGPDIVEIEIFDITEENIMYKAREEVEKTQAFTFQERNATFTTEMQRGYYWIQVYFEGEEQKYTEKVLLEIESEPLLEEHQRKEAFSVLDVFIILLFILVAIITFRKNL